MSPFDQDPREEKESYKCDYCSGNITLNKNSNDWECDGCEFVAPNNI
jgi:ribosomal protein L37AE/L43A